MDVLNRFVVVATAVVALGGFLFGFDTGIVSGALLFIGEEFALSVAAHHVMVGSLLLAAVVGAFLGGPSSAGAGRKKTLIGTAILFITGAVVSEAVRRRKAAGALACTDYGAMRAPPAKVELERFMSARSP